MSNICQGDFRICDNVKSMRNEMLPVALGAVEAVVTRAAVICVDWRVLHHGDPPSCIPEVDGEDEHAGDEEEDGCHIDLQSLPLLHTTKLSWT